MKEILKEHKVFGLIEFFVLVSDFINYLRNEKFLFAFVFVFIIYVVFLVAKFFYIKRKNDKNVPDKIGFIVDFIQSVGYDNSWFIRKVKDNNHCIDLIYKKYKIDGINCSTEKIYSGTVLSKISDGIDILTCGGSSASSQDIKISSYIFKNNKYHKTVNEVKQDKERVKILKLKFDNVLSEHSNFKVKYLEKNWSGSMRNDYDAIIVAEHILFHNVKNQIIDLEFMKGNIESIETYSYNIKNHELSIVDEQLPVQNNKYHFEFESHKISNDCIYFILYTYEI